MHGIALLAAVLASTCRAQIAVDGSGALAPVGGVFTIEQSAGLERGSNLFHSFATFNLDSGQTAKFTGSGTFSNILSRVTGGTASSINGTIDTLDFAGANLFLLNPAGLVFGPDAALNVDGSFYGTTADYIRMSSGPNFDLTVSLGPDSPLEAASPVAFGFLGENNPGDIRLGGSRLGVAADRTVSLVGGNITLEGGAQIAAGGGRVDLVSVASGGEVVAFDADGNPIGPEMNGFTELGEVALTDAGLATTGPGGGSVFIRGGRVVADGSFITSSVFGDGAPEAPDAHGIDIEASGEVALSRSSFDANVFPGASRDSGPIRIVADRLDATRTFLNSVVFFQNPQPGRSGGILIDASTVNLSDGTLVRSNTFGSGDSGAIEIRSGRLDVTNAAVLTLTWFRGTTGRAGDVTITSDEVTITGTPRDTFAFITSQTSSESSGRAGDVRVTASRLTMTGPTEISSSTFSAGAGGNVEVRADEILISDQPDPATFAGIIANTLGEGPGGQLLVEARNLTLTDRGTIQSRTLGTGDAGGAVVNVSENLTVRNGAFITTNGLFGAGGAAADLEINAGSLHIEGIADAEDPFSPDTFTGISTAAMDGAGGDLLIRAGTLRMTDNAVVSAASLGRADSGSISIVATDGVRLEAGSQIGAQATSTGRAGDIEIRTTETIALDRGQISTEATQADGGDVGLEGDQVMLRNGSRISSSVGAGDAGDISIVAVRSATLESGSAVQAEANGSGLAGDIVIRAGEGIVLDDGQVSTEAAAADGGTVELHANDISMRAGSQISSSVDAGTSGAVSLTATRNVTLEGDSQLRAQATGVGLAGNIRVRAGETISLDQSRISTEAVQSDGGDIKLDADVLVVLRDSVISSSVGTGEGAGGNISIDPVFVVLNNSQVRANAFGGPGGNITVVTEYFIADPDSVVDASSARNIDGSIVITSPDTDALDPVSVLTTEFVDAASRLAERCASRGTQAPASLVGLGRGGLPVPPSGPRVSLYSTAGSAAAPVAHRGAVRDQLLAFVPDTMVIECDS